MFRKRISKIFWSSFTLALVVHVGIAFFFSSAILKQNSLNDFINPVSNDKTIKLDEISFVNQKKIKTVGVKDGVKNANRPDIKSPPPKVGKQKLSLDNLAPDKFVVDENKKDSSINDSSRSMDKNKQASMTTGLSKKIQEEINPTNNTNSHFYYNPSNGGVITKNKEQEVIKSQASRESQAYVNPAMSKISNFEIRYDRPEGVSEDELNSDEKAYYSFYVRSYKTYFTKIYSNYEKVLVERPGLRRAFDSKHLLVGKIDYDVNGEIVRVKIIKSSENDDLHYFFEETLKQLVQPNPPKVFVKNKEGFSIYYQLQIN